MAYKQHGKFGTRVYRIWHGMKNRCLNPNPNAATYKYYASQGVTVCERWLDFRNFYADMGEPPSDVHTLDRYPNRFGNYEPSNCRWALPVEQIEGRSNARVLTFQGRTQSVARWAKEIGLKYDTLIARLYRGTSVERALTAPLGDVKGLRK